MRRQIGQVIDRVRQFFLSPYFGFVQGHVHLTPEELSQIKSLIGKHGTGVVENFESQFAKLVGDGEAISYAAGRMGFYDLMLTLGVGDGDEVILPGATCVVMVNAVLRTGAKPVFSDIDPNTFGSDAQCIEACISPKTRLIVAQHSFGIPCNIVPITELARLKGVFLLEDCALTLGSKIDGVVVGNFGDAALFSTDHSKPLNTMTGGLIYTLNKELAHRLRQSQSGCLELPFVKQLAIWQRILLEMNYCVPEKYGRMGLINLFDVIRKKMFHAVDPFFSADFNINHNMPNSYPAKLPAFLAMLGLIELKRWRKVASERRLLLQKLMDVACHSSLDVWLPKAYKNERLEIVPLRFVWTQPNGASFRLSIKHFIHVSWTWFMRPVVATDEHLEKFGYHSGACPISEHVGPNMVNFPCNVSIINAEKLINLFRKAVA